MSVLVSTRTLIVAATLLTLLASPSARAIAEDENTIQVPANAKFVVHVDLAAFRSTQIGARLFEMAKREAIKEIKNETDFEELQETLGFDPFTELDGVTIVGTDFKAPQEHLNVILKLRQTVGNLEDMATTLPGYASSDYGNHTIHSAEPEDDQHVYGSVHTDKRGTKRIIAARQQLMVQQILDMLDGTSRSEPKATELPRTDGQFVHVELLEVPDQGAKRGRQANLARLMQGLRFELGEDGTDVVLSLTIKTQEDKQAKQVRQIIQGMRAVIQLVDDGGENEELQQARELLENLEIKRRGNKVHIRLAVPERDLVELIEDGMARVWRARKVRYAASIK